MYVGRATRLTRQGSGDQHWNVDQMRGGVFFLVDVGQFCLLCSVGIEVRGGAAGGGRVAEGSIATGKPACGANILYDVANARFGDGSAVCEQGRRVRVALRLKRSALTDPGGEMHMCIPTDHTASLSLCHSLHAPSFNASL